MLSKRDLGVEDKALVPETFPEVTLLDIEQHAEADDPGPPPPPPEPEERGTCPSCGASGRIRVSRRGRRFISGCVCHQPGEGFAP